MVHILPTIFDTFHNSDSCIAGGCWSGTGVYTSRSQLAAAALRSAAHASEDRSTPPQVDWAVLKRGSNVAKNLMTSAAAGKKGKWRNAHSSEDWSPQEKLRAFWQHYCGWTNGQKLAKNVTFWDPCPSFLWSRDEVQVMFKWEAEEYGGLSVILFILWFSTFWYAELNLEFEIS